MAGQECTAILDLPCIFYAINLSDSSSVQVTNISVTEPSISVYGQWGFLFYCFVPPDFAFRQVERQFRMSETPERFRNQLLDPIERSSEVLFGLIMVLTFTGSLRASGFARDDVRRMLIGALGCNLAWGIIDAIFYLMATLSERGHTLVLLRDIQAATPEKGRHILASAISDDVAEVLTDIELESVRARMAQLPRSRRHAHLHGNDYLAALGVFLLVFLSTFPVVVPFFFMQHANRALRISNLIGIIMLFFVGTAYGKYADRTPWKVGLVMVLIGLVMVGLTIALGG